jgi:hypothetical protein
MIFRLTCPKNNVQGGGRADSPETFHEGMKQILWTMTQGEADFYPDDVATLEARVDIESPVVLLDVLPIFMEIGSTNRPSARGIDNEGGFQKWCYSMYEKATALFAAQPPAGGEATVAAGEPEIGSGKPDKFGCGGAGCGDLTCAYCCQDFADPEDVGGVDHEADTEEMEVVKATPMTLLPPHPSKCQECAVDHDPKDPHNQESLYYQTKFHMRHGRSPTWTDAMAHCDEATKKNWREELVGLMKEHGLDVPEDLR